jgi:acyl carrier protein
MVGQGSWDKTDGCSVFAILYGGAMFNISSTTKEILNEKANGMENVLSRVQEVFQEAFGIKAELIFLETTPSDVPGWDSVGHLDLASRLERVLGVSFDVDDLMEMESVRDIVRIVNSKL